MIESSTSGGGAASTWHGIMTVPPNGARVFSGNGCLSKFGANAVKQKEQFCKKMGLCVILQPFYLG